MWMPWTTALLTGVFAGCASIWALREAGFLYLTVSGFVMAIVVASLTWLGLRASRRPLLPAKVAVVLVVVVALVEFYSTQPVAIHAVLSSLPSGTPDDRMFWIYLFGIASLTAPALIAVAAGWIAGAPPNTSSGRTRER